MKSSRRSTARGAALLKQVLRKSAVSMLASKFLTSSLKKCTQSKPMFLTVISYESASSISSSSSSWVARIGSSVYGLSFMATNNGKEMTSS